MTEDLFRRYERYLFGIVLLLNLFPVWGVSYFFTGDGPAHLYNSNIILQLLSGNPGRIAEFFQIRWELIPNLGGHVLLTLFNAFLPAAIAEKLIYTIGLIALPMGFRYVVSSFDKDTAFYAFLSLPLAHNFCFYIGFQSFSIALGLMLFCIGYCVRLSGKDGFWSYVTLSILMFVTTVFHLFAAAIGVICIGVFLIIQLLVEGKKRWNSFLWTVLALLPAVAFALFFVLQNTGDFHFNEKPFSELWHGVLKGWPLITVDTIETKYSEPFNIILLAGLLIGVFFRTRKKVPFGCIDFAWISTLLFLGLYFVMPDKLASGSFVSMRLLLAAFLFAALTIALFLQRHVLGYVLMFSVVVLNLIMVRYHYNKAAELSRDVEAVVSANEYIPVGSTVVPLNYSYHWLQYNIGLYPGGEKKLIILDNYEASTSHFPVIWRESAFPGDRLGDFGFSKRPELKIKPYEDFSRQRVDAVIRWAHDYSMEDRATAITDSILREMFVPTYISGDGKVEVHLRK